MKLLSFFPLLAYAVLFAFTTYAAWIVGHWPVYGEPDPKDLPTGSLREIVLCIALVAIASIPFFGGTYALRCRQGAWGLKKRQLQVWALGLATVIWAAEIIWLPRGGGLLGWLLD